MLFWIFVIMTAVGIVWGIIDEYSDGAVVLIIFGILTSIILLTPIAINNIGVKGTVQKLHTRYDTLVYQYENDIYDNDNDLGKRELITDIQEWNEDLVWYQENQDNFWIGIFIPNIYDEFKMIELK